MTILTFTRLLYICIDKDFRIPIVVTLKLERLVCALLGGFPKGAEKGVIPITGALSHYRTSANPLDLLAAGCTSMNQGCSRTFNIDIISGTQRRYAV